MTTSVEAAFLSVLAALTTRANQGDDVIPVPMRNAVLLESPDNQGRFLNVVDGDSIPRDEIMVGNGTDDEFELAVTLEWSISQAASGPRDAAFDAGMTGIAEALGQNAGGDRTLGGAVDYIRLVRVSRDDLALDGFPSVKTAVLEFRITMTAPSLIG